MPDAAADTVEEEVDRPAATRRSISSCSAGLKYALLFKKALHLVTLPVRALPHFALSLDTWAGMPTQCTRLTKCPRALQDKSAHVPAGTERIMCPQHLVM